MKGIALDEDGDINKFSQIKWRTTLSKKVEKFAEIIRDDEIFNKYFGEEYVVRLTDKSKKITQLTITLGIVYVILMLSLFASQNIGDSEFELFGYGFKNLSHYKEFLLLLASITSPISSILEAHKKYINALVGECLKKISPNEIVRKFYSNKFIDDYIDSFVPESSGGATVPHSFATFVLGGFVLVLIALLVALLVGSFLIQISVIVDVIRRPSLPFYLNIFIVSISIASILLSWILLIIQMPMPEVDFSNSVRLSEIKESNPEKYQHIMGRLVKENAKKDKFSTLILSAIIFTSSFVGIGIYFFPDSLQNLPLLLGNAITGLLVVSLLSTQLSAAANKWGWRWYFNNYKDGDARRVAAFGSLKRIMLYMKIAFPLLFTIVYSIYSFN